MLQQNFELVGVVVDNFLIDYDLSLVELMYDGLLYLLKKKDITKRKIKTVLKVEKSVQVLDDPSLMFKYKQALMGDTSGKIRFMDPSNFYYSDKQDRIASKDFRVLIHDFVGDVPQDVLSNAASVALLMLTGKCDQATGYNYIRNLLMKYGKAEFTFQMNGFLHVSVNNNVTWDYKSKVTMLNDIPKM